MAATVSPWSKPGAWALDAEEHEEELLKQQNDAESASDFPTLTAAAATKTSKKKKKGQTVSLSEFTTYGGPKPAADSAGLTPEDLMALPKGPRERTEEELARAGRGGFRSFDRQGRGGDESRWGGSGRSADRERSGGGGGRDGVRDLGPSRADEVDDWASTKKSPATMNNGYDRRERDGGRDRGGFFDSQSKADESESWFSNKSYAPPPPPEGRRYDRDRRGGGGFGSGNGGADSDFWGKKREESNGPGSESGPWSGRPRLNLQPRTLPVAANGGPASSEAVAAKPKGANPFGAARPREEVLAEKGQDWKKIDEQLDSMKIREAGERAERGGGGFGKRSFGSGNGRLGLPSDRTEATWRKPEANGSDNADAASESAEKNEEEPAEEQN